jgi:hypothetical protein
MDIKEAESIAKDLKDIDRVLKSIAGAMNNVIGTARSVKHLINLKHNNLGSKLITAGAACVVFPEPIFSDILGCTLIAAGAIINRSKGLTVFDVFKEAKRIELDLKRFNRDLDALKI